MAHLEHVNITVADPQKTAAFLTDLFGWHTRWEGGAANGGYTVHVGTSDGYIALYTGPGGAAHQKPADDSYSQRAGFNHVGIVVDDVDATEKKVKSLGYETYSHADYEPGKRFYFHDVDGVEYEVISYP